MAIRVLHILAGSDVYNGVSDFLLSYYSNMDREKIHFDFMFCRENSMRSRQNSDFLKDSEFIELRMSISGKMKDLTRLCKRIKEELSARDYDIVHIDTGSVSITATCVLAARMAGVRKIISHSHNSDSHSAKKGRLISRISRNLSNSLFRPLIRHFSILLFACSKESAEYLFGKKVFNLSKYHQINNAIYVDKFVYNSEIRKHIREKNGIKENTIVMGAVGRITAQKNPLFLIDVFSEFRKLEPSALLWIVGDGDLREETQKKVQQLGLNDCVVFLGQRSDVNQLMQAMDILVLPSIYEGLGIVSIEAQASGLLVFLSDECSHGSDISDLIRFISLDEGATIWAKNIQEFWKDREKRKDMYSVLVQNGYDIKTESHILEKYYLDLMKD